MMNLKRCIGLLLVIAGLNVPAFAQDDAGVQNLQVYYMKEGVDLSSYDRVMLDSLGLDDSRVVPPPWVQGEDRSLKRWKLTDSDIKWLRNSYQTIVAEALTADGGPEVVAEPGPGVLIVDIEIVGLMPYARRGEKVTTRGFGEALVQAQLRDGSTEELLAVFEGWQDVGSDYVENTRFNNENNIRALFRVWGARLRAMLDQSAA